MATRTIGLTFTLAPLGHADDLIDYRFASGSLVRKADIERALLANPNFCVRGRISPLGPPPSF
jgi:hypothetical protein